MTEPQAPKAIMFLDFDGTISRRDAIDAILEAHADARWLAFEREWREGRIGSRECLRAQMELVRATRVQLDELLDRIEVDKGFAALLETCAAHGVPAHIISDGFDYCIRRILARARPRLGPSLRGMRVCASHLEPHEHGWQIEFPFFQQTCGHGCATCKPAVMRLLNPWNAPAIFVGDGLSDRYAAESADLLFAKNGLAAHCLEHSIEHIAYDGLSDVAARLGLLLRSDAFLERESETRASA